LIQCRSIFDLFAHFLFLVRSSYRTERQTGGRGQTNRQDS